VKYKIAIIEPAGNLYGSEMVLQDILEYINHDKYEFLVYLPPGSPFKDKVNSLGIETIELLPISNSGKVNKFIYYVKLLIHLWKHKYQLFFINQGGILRPLSIISKILRIPIVCEVSTLEDAKWVSTLSKQYIDVVTTFITNSLYIYNSLSIDSARKAMLYYGYKYKGLNGNLRSNTNRNKSGQFKILLLGRISKSKGHFLLIEAAKKLKDENIQFIIAGDTDKGDTYREFTDLIKDYGLVQKFKLLGYQSNIGKVINEADIMVIPSVAEPFGRIFCEAAEAQIVTIVANSGGLGELSERFNFGVKFKPQNANDLATKIKEVIYSYESYYHECQKTSKDFLDALDIKTYADQIETILDSGIKGETKDIIWQGEKR